MLLNSELKKILLRIIPLRYQVPIKFHYNHMKSELEPELAMLKFLVNEGDRVIDIGGNLGVYSYKLLQLGARVSVFEPNVDCSNILKAWAANKPMIEVEIVALSNQEGFSLLHIPIDKDGVEHSASASIDNVKFVNARDQQVELRTLDSYKYKEVSFIKIDVEGHELRVIEGAEKTIESLKPAILVEIEQRHNNMAIDDVFRKVTSLGYKGFFLKNTKLTSLTEFNVKEHQTMKAFDSKIEAYVNNFIFLHSTKLSEGSYDSLFGYFAK